MSAVLYEKRGSTAWVTLNRPEAKNMMNAEMFAGLLDAWQAIRDDREVRVAILTATGDVDFCVGGDLRELIPLWTKAKQPETELERQVADPRVLDRIMLKTEPLDKPIIGAINGRAYGGGTEILLLTDIRVAAEHATFGLPEPRSGIVPGAGAMARLARQIPYAHAMKIMLTAEPITASEALAYGLISEVVPADRLLARAEELAAMVCRNAPLSMGVIKRTVLATHTMDWADAFRFEARESAVATRSKDAKEGPRAFKEHREPNWTGE
jgi:enoyl-CoA hydratase